MWNTVFILLFVSSFGASMLTPVKDLGPRIINGDQATLGQFPWQAALQLQSSSSGWFCGGAIISEEWILTSGDCVKDAVSATITVGTVNLDSGGDQYESAQFILHNAYDPHIFENNIGLIRLSRRLIFNVNILPVALASSELEGGVNITASGWGSTHNSDTSVSNVLNYVTLRTYSTHDCEQIIRAHISDSVVCATGVGSITKSVCGDDNGGPVVINASSNPVHVGIIWFVSSGGCDSDHVMMFTRTAFYRDWIRSSSGV